MIEITQHHWEGAPACRVFAIDEPDHEKGGGAHHRYAVVWGEGADDPQDHTVDRFLLLADAGRAAIIDFQHGPIQECGINGLDAESLVAIVLHRLDCFQAGPFACEANARARTNLGQGLVEMLRRTRDRVARMVEGHNIQ